MNTQLSPAKTSKGEKSRKNIICSTRNILAKRDLVSLTLEDVATESHIAKSSILWHFGSKNGLLLAVVDEIFDDILHKLNNIPFDHAAPQNNLETLVASLALEMKKNPEANALLIAFIVNKTLDKTIIQKIRKMYQHYRKSIEHQLVNLGFNINKNMAITLLAIIDGIYLQWYLEPKEVDFEKELLRAISSLQL